MKLLHSTIILAFCALISCSTTKTTKVYIEVGVNDYTKTKANSTISGKSKKLNSGETTYHAVDTSKPPVHPKKHH